MLDIADQTTQRSPSLAALAALFPSTAGLTISVTKAGARKPGLLCSSSVQWPVSSLGAIKLPSSKVGGGLGIRKLTTKPSKGLYDQKPAEIVTEPLAPAPPSGGIMQSAPRTSRFVYSDDSLPTSESLGSDNSKTGHVAAPPTVSDFFAGFGASPIKTTYSNGRSEAQPEDSYEAQRKFANAKSISSAQYFGNQEKNGDSKNSGRLQKFAVSFLVRLSTITPVVKNIQVWQERKFFLI